MIFKVIWRFIFLTIFFSLFFINYSFSTEISNCYNITSSGYYNLTTNILNSNTNYCINISANNVILDCQANLIQGNGSAGAGIYAERSSGQNANITINNCHVDNWGTQASSNSQVHFKYTNNIKIINSSSSNSNGYIHGIVLENVDGAYLKNVTANNNYNGISLYINNLNIILENINTSNNIYGLNNAVVSSTNISNYTSNNNREGIRLDSSSSVNVNNMEIKNNSDYGIHIKNPSSSKFNNISNGIISESGKFDIWLGTSFGPSDCNLFDINNVNSSGNREIKLQATGTTISNKEYGELIICDADGVVNLNNVTVKGSDSLRNNGIIFYNHNHAANSVWDNVKSEGNLYGIYTESFAYQVEIRNSQFIDNEYGFYLIYFGGFSLPNKVYNNTFNNTNNIYLGSGINELNYWNNSVMGNYYYNPDGTGFSELCSDLNSNGICDYPYKHKFNNTDYFPRTKNLGQSYNFSILSCRQLFENGSHSLVNDILNSSKSKCLEIITDNISLDCQNNMIQGQDTSGSYGIYVDSSNINIDRCNVDYWGNGIYLSTSNNNNISNSIFSNNSNGIVLSYLNSSNIFNNKNYGNNYGIVSSYSKNNNVFNNNISDNDIGFYYTATFGNVIYNNTISSTVGSVFFSISNNNSWNNSLMGNIWLNPSNNGFSQTCNDTSPVDGFCDTNLTLSATNIDFFPIYFPYVAPVSSSSSLGSVFPLQGIIAIIFLLLLLLMQFIFN
ncbi:MAG: right-handed parallel beta-helix repeat-containing protein [Nanoarchaeota archaeon]|nr:right-handed parallel beta-helix repeat-containing protein [Nanoarchaeota archaeon]